MASQVVEFSELVWCSVFKKPSRIFARDFELARANGHLKWALATPTKRTDGELFTVLL